MSDRSDFEFHRNKRPGKTYVSRRFGGDQRIASKVVDSDGVFYEAVLRDEVVLRVTPRRRQEIVAKFFENDAELRVVTFQRWNVEKGVPREKVSFSFKGAEIELLLNFLQNIARFHFANAEKVNVHDDQLRTVVATTEQMKAFLTGNMNLVAQIAENEITERDIIALGYRRKQLAHFERLLEDRAYFSHEADGRAPEAVWQAFFETNSWVFGYGLSYIFMDALNGRRLEQTVRGFSVAERGKRADALMKTRAEVSSLCFVEIKRHDTDLLMAKPYRSGVWTPSADLVGGVAQAQETVRAAVQALSAPFRPRDHLGDPTGEEIYGFEPRSYLVIGRLAEFFGEHGINEEKFRSFEMYRRNIRQPEIITFDELMHRARFIVNHDGTRKSPDSSHSDPAHEDLVTDGEPDLQ